MVNEKPKEGVKTEKNDHINLKVLGQVASVAWSPLQILYLPLSAPLLFALCLSHRLKNKQTSKKIKNKKKIKRHTTLSKLMEACCQPQGLSIRQIRFSFERQPASETDIPTQLEIEEEDKTDVFQQQTEGVY
uniref:small ubiquitin-related modifier 2-like n=1 Tax=Panthera onca TaxID=9690 RepID=UPI002952A600|nr:small ubiquitin-related modifier 2-like [Panthera onca]